MRTLIELVVLASKSLDRHEILLADRMWAGDVKFKGKSFEISPGKARNGIFRCVGVLCQGLLRMEDQDSNAIS